MNTETSRYLTAFSAIVSATAGKDALNLRHMQVLAILCEADRPVRVPDLAQRIKLDRSWVTRIIDLLVKKKLVDRRDDPADRRQMILMPTRIGRNLNARTKETFDTIIGSDV